MLFLHNLGPDDVTVDLSSIGETAELPNDVLADSEYPDPGKLADLPVSGYGYRWIRVRRTA